MENPKTHLGECNELSRFVWALPLSNAAYLKAPFADSFVEGQSYLGTTFLIRVKDSRLWSNDQLMFLRFAQPLQVILVLLACFSRHASCG